MTQKLINKADLMTKDSEAKNTIVDFSQIVEVGNPKSYKGDSICFVMVDKKQARS